VTGCSPLEALISMFYVYVLQSIKDGQWYTGYASDLKRRIKEHNLGRNFSTKHRIPFCLIYYEACLSEKDAKTREKYLKSGMGKRYLKNRMRYFLSTSNGL